jgi:hypothetical protein
MATNAAGSTLRSGDGWRVAVAGASGFVGSALVTSLESQGHTVIRLGRPHRGHHPDVVWDPGRGMLEPKAIEGIDAAINVAGERIDQRWTREAKRRILESRVRSTEVLAGALAALRARPRVLVNMSAVGAYGNRGDEIVDEKSAPGEGFLAGVVRAWEAATERASDAGIRVVTPRCGVILHPSGSILGRLIPIYQLGGGGKIGSGKQWISWISRTDALRALIHLVGAESLGGAVNVTSPEPARNEEFGKVLARVLRRPALATTPPLLVKLLFGEMGEETVLAGQRVLPARLRDAGFEFQHPSLESAIRHEMASPE